MRIVSLSPSTTELLFALGLDDEVVGVTHACSYPWAATQLPQVTIGDAASAGSPAEAGSPRPISSGVDRDTVGLLDSERIADLEPDLIVMPGWSAIAHATYDEVEAIAQTLPSAPKLLELTAATIGEMLANIRTLGNHTDREDEADELLDELTARIDRVKLAAGDSSDRPRVLALASVEVPAVWGLWLPQMIEMAGGLDLLGMPGEDFEQIEWELAATLKPELTLVVIPYRDAATAADEANNFAAEIGALGPGRVVAIDPAAGLGEPSHRLIDGLELLSFLINPTTGIEPPEGSWIEVSN